MFIRLASILVLFLLIFSAYSNTFQVPPVLDDIHSFVEEPKLQVESFTFHNLKATIESCLKPFLPGIFIGEKGISVPFM